MSFLNEGFVQNLNLLRRGGGVSPVLPTFPSFFIAKSFVYIFHIWYFATFDKIKPKYFSKIPKFKYKVVISWQHWESGYYSISVEQ